jgi:diguanylate cyclase (GGDEF)-like protein
VAAGKEACLIVIYSMTGLYLGKKYTLAGQTLTVGRSSGADIQIEDEAISRNHCEIVDTGQTVAVRDLGSTNGTGVNNELVDEQILRDGDLVKIGHCIFKFLSGNNIENAYQEEIYRLTTIDGLTQIFNRRYFFDNLEREMERGHRYKRDVSLILFDIDHFKCVNDKYGHLAGDDVLSQLARLLKSHVRRADTLARCGGEKFAIILPESDASSALLFGEKIREVVEHETFQHKDIAIQITISIGVAPLTPGLKNAEMFVYAADKKLQDAKKAGRNRVTG